MAIAIQRLRPVLTQPALPHHELTQHYFANGPAAYVEPADFQSGALQGFDVVVFPGGSATEQAAMLCDSGKDEVRKFVRAGGGYVGICGGTFLATAEYKCGMSLVNAKPLVGKVQVPGKGVVSIAARGAGPVRMQLTNAGGKILGGTSGLMDIRYSSGPILSPAGLSELPDYVSLAMFRTEIWQHEAQRYTMIGTPAIIAGRFGNGRVIIFSPHPEMTAGLEPQIARALLATAHMRLADVAEPMDE